MTRGIVSGAVDRPVEIRTSKAGKEYASLTICESVNGGRRWWKANAFSSSAIEVLREMSVGEPIAAAGEIDADVYAPAGSEARVNWNLKFDGILSARKVKPEGATRKPQAAKRDRAEASSARQAEASNTGGRALAAASWASPARAEVETPLDSEKGANFDDDDIPF